MTSNGELCNSSSGEAEQHCEHSGVNISYKNWSHHIKAKKHERLAPNVQSELMKVKGLRALARDLNMSGFSTPKKKELHTNNDKVIGKRFNEHELKQQTVKQVRELAMQYKIKAPPYATLMRPLCDLSWFCSKRM